MCLTVHNSLSWSHWLSLYWVTSREIQLIIGDCCPRIPWMCDCEICIVCAKYFKKLNRGFLRSPPWWCISCVCAQLCPCWRRSFEKDEKKVTLWTKNCVVCKYNSDWRAIRLFASACFAWNCWGKILIFHARYYLEIWTGHVQNANHKPYQCVEPLGK
jgi:hypothetical protein